ncbi:MAG: YfhO family protein, partial [Candidatus Andersenbacteria bacterium]|nr:YfhO family protein [Candidatus Andersenbacteria bacterium]
ITRWVIAGAWFSNDLVTITTSLENLYSNIQRSGQSPLWAPELAGGYPLLANGQLSFWYPPHMLLRQFLPAVWTLNLSLLWHSILVAVGTFLFLRINKVNRIAAGVGALLLPFGGAFVGKYEMVNLILPVAWVPVLFLLLQLFLGRGQLFVLLGWIAASILCVLAGHVQMAVQVFIFEAIFVLCYVWLDWRRWSRAVVIFLGVLLIVGLTLPALLPIGDVVPFTNRAGGVSTDEELFEFSFSLRATKGILHAHPFGHGESYIGPKNEAELASYLGPLAVVLALLGVLVSKKKFRFLWSFSLVSIVIGLLLSFGDSSPVYRWLVSIGWQYFNVPARFFLFTHFGLVFLAAMGIHWLISYIPNGRLNLGVVSLLGLVTVMPVLWVGWFWYGSVPWDFTREPSIANVLQRQDGGNNVVRVFSKEQLSNVSPNDNFGITVWDPVCSTCLYRQNFVSPFDVVGGIKLRLSRASEEGLVDVKLFSDKGEKIREASLDSRNVKDGEWNNLSFQPVNNALNRSFYFEVTSDLPRNKAPRLFIHTNSSGEQYDPTGLLFSCKEGVCESIKADLQTVDAAFAVSVPSDNYINSFGLLAPNVPAGYGIGSAQWAGSLGLLDVIDYLKPLDERSEPSAWQENRSLVNRFPITHAVGLFPPYRYATNLPDFTEVVSVPFGDEFIRVYENNEAFPRLSFVEDVKAMAGGEKQREALSRLGAQDEKTVVADVLQDESFSSGGVANIQKDERSRIIIETQNDAKGFLVLRDVLLPGWMAVIDGDQVPIKRVDSLFRGVEVPAGSHSVVLQYKPSWLKVAFVVTVLALSCIVMLIYVGLKGFAVGVGAGGESSVLIEPFTDGEDVGK